MRLFAQHALSLFAPRAPARLRPALLAGLCLAALVSGGSARAQQFTSLYAFGDSYADTGNLWKILGYSAPPATYPTGRFSGGTNFNDTLSSIYNIPQYNFAIGGAMTGATNIVAAGVPGFAYEWGTFFPSTGGTIPANALVTLSIGGNDGRYYEIAGLPVAGAPAAAALASANTIAGVNALVGYGARTLVFVGGGDVSTLPEAVGYTAAQRASGSAFSTAYNADVQAALAPVAAAGTRVEFVNLSYLAAEIQALPALYGLKSGGSCGLGNFAFCLTPAGQSQYLFYADGIHLTSAGFTILGEYIANRLNAPQTLGVTGSTGVNATLGFVGTMFGRLDLFNPPTAQAEPGFMADVSAIKGPVGAAQSPWSVYIQANGGFGSRSNTSNSLGYHWDGAGGAIGLEYRLAPDLLVGAAYNYANPNQRLNQRGGSSSLDAYQFGLYSAYAGKNLFAEALLSYGWLTYANSRPGVIDNLTSSPSGASLAAALKTGYLFDIAPATRLGPIVGVTYARAHILGYSEMGDTVLNLAVNPQNAVALLGDAGLQARHAFASPYGGIDTYLNVTAENYFNGSSRTIQYAATASPQIINSWNVTGAPNHAFARVAAGASMNVTSSIALQAYLSQTLGQPGGQDFSASGGFKYAF